MDAGELDLIKRLAGPHRVYAAGADLCASTTGRSSLKLIMSGWAARTRVLRDGRRQIFSFLIPGDVVSLRHRADGWSSTAVTAITRIEAVEAGGLCDDIERRLGGCSSLSKACAAAAASEDDILLAQVVRLGVQDAGERMAHLFLELHARLDRIGLCKGFSFSLPLKQEHLAEMLGMSLVHVNRTLQRLRLDGLVELKSGRLTILQPRQLAWIAQYETVGDLLAAE